MLGAYLKLTKQLNINKEAIKDAHLGKFSDKTFAHNPDVIIISGKENSDELTEIIMSNNEEHRLKIFLLIIGTMNSWNNITVKDTFFKLQKVNSSMFNDLADDFFQHFGVKPPTHPNYKNFNDDLDKAETLEKFVAKGGRVGRTKKRTSLDIARGLQQLEENSRKSNGNGGCLGLLLVGFILAIFLGNV